MPNVITCMYAKIAHPVGRCSHARHGSAMDIMQSVEEASRVVLSLEDGSELSLVLHLFAMLTAKLTEHQLGAVGPDVIEAAVRLKRLVMDAHTNKKIAASAATALGNLSDSQLVSDILRDQALVHRLLTELRTDSRNFPVAFLLACIASIDYDTLQQAAPELLSLVSTAVANPLSPDADEGCLVLGVLLGGSFAVEIADRLCGGTITGLTVACAILAPTEHTIGAVAALSGVVGADVHDILRPVWAVCLNWVTMSDLRDVVCEYIVNMLTRDTAFDPGSAVRASLLAALFEVTPVTENIGRAMRCLSQTDVRSARRVARHLNMKN